MVQFRGRQFRVPRDHLPCFSILLRYHGFTYNRQCRRWGNGIVALCGGEDLSRAPRGVRVLVEERWKRGTLDSSIALEYLGCRGER